MCVDNMKERKKKSNKNGLGGKKRRKMIKKKWKWKKFEKCIFFLNFFMYKKIKENFIVCPYFLSFFF